MAEKDEVLLLCQSGEEHLGQKEWPEADEAFKRALELDPKSKVALLGRATTVRCGAFSPWLGGKTEEAQHVLNRGLYHYPGDADLLREQGLLYLHRSQYDQAQKAFDQVLAAAPGDLPSLAGKLRCLRMQGRLEEGLAVAAGLPADLGKAPELRREIGLILVAQEKYDSAVEAFLDAGGDDVVIEEMNAADDAHAPAFLAAIDARLGTHLPVLWQIAYWHRTYNRNAEALRIADRILAIQPHDERGLCAKIEILHDLGRLSEALRAGKEALRLLGAKRLAIVEQYSRVLVAGKQYEAAVEALADADDENLNLRVLDWHPVGELERFTEALLARLPNDPRLLSGAAQRMFKKQNYRQAVQYWDRLLGLNPNDVEATLGKIDCLLSQSPPDGVEPELSEAFEKFGAGHSRLLERKARLYLIKGACGKAFAVGVPDQQMGDLLADYAQSLREENRLEEAEKMLDAGMARFPNCVKLLRQLAWLYFERRRFDQAGEVWAGIAKLFPQDDDRYWECLSLRASGQFSKASEALDRALPRAVKYNRSRLLLERGLVHELQGEFTSAVSDYDEILAAERFNTLAYVGKSRAFHAQQRDDEAEKALGEGLKYAPGSAAIVTELAKLNYDRNDLKRAEQGCAKAIELDPGYLPAHFGRAELLLRMNRGPEATSSLQALLVARPGDVAVQCELALHYIARNMWGPAKKELNEILAKFPDNIRAINGLGTVYINEGHFDQAEDQFRKAVENDRFEGTLFRNLAWAQVRQVKGTAHTGALAVMDQRKLADAEANCRKALDLEPNRAQTYACLGIIAFKRGKLLDSEDYLKRAADLDPRDSSQVDLGALYAQMGRYNDAQKVLEDGRKLDRYDVGVRIELGNVYLQTGQVKDAVAVLREARAIEPREDVIRALAVALMRDGQGYEAGRVVRNALRELDTADCWQLHLTLCRLLSDLGEKSEDAGLQEEALREASLAIRIQPDRPEPYFYAGVVAFKLKDYRRALRHFQQCCQLDPENFEAEQNLRKAKAAHWKELVLTRGGRGAGWVLGLVCFVILAVVWVAYYRQVTPGAPITAAMLLTLTPILLGLTFVALLLPYLSKLKLPGMEAEMSQPKDQLSAGPTGNISIGVESISSGPR